MDLWRADLLGKVKNNKLMKSTYSSWRRKRFNIFHVMAAGENGTRPDHLPSMPSLGGQNMKEAAYSRWSRIEHVEENIETKSL